MKAHLRPLCGIVILMLAPSIHAAPPDEPAVVSADAAVILRNRATGPWTMTERSDFSRYENGRYTGHVYREVRAHLSPQPGGGYRGPFIVLEETLRNELLAARPVDEVVEVALSFGKDGSMLIAEDRGLPQLRGFPAFPATAVVPGSSWTVSAERALDPDNSAVITRVTIFAACVYRGRETYKGREVFRVSAKYASRYRNPQAQSGGFSGLEGTHDVDILIDAASGLPLLMRDRLDETFTFPDGRTLRHKGFTLIFSEFVAPLDTGGLVAALRGPAPASSMGPDRPLVPGDDFELEDGTVASPNGTDSGALPPLGPVDGITVAQGERGLVLTLENVRFKPDSDEFLADEAGRLDRIARALASAGKRQILVEGHTADVGRPEAEAALSLRRAKRTVDELVARGLPAALFVYRGLGATDPLVPNTSEENRARNRRVEITILE